MKKTDERSMQEKPDQRNETIKEWEEKCNSALVGKCIKYVGYLNEDEQRELGWYKRSLIIFFTDGTAMYPSVDEEGNDAGVYFTTISGLEVIPRL